MSQEYGNPFNRPYGNFDEFWNGVAPEVKSVLADEVFSPTGELWPPELRDKVQDAVLKDFTDEQQGDE